jgi:hypothetical protein
MCNPAIAIGLATTLMGAVQSIAGYQAESQAASASERAYQETRNAALQQQNTQDQKAQLKLKGENEQAAQKAEMNLVRRLQAQGTTLAAGRAGQSVGGLLADAERVEGKDLGALGMNLAYAQQDYYFNVENNFLAAKSTINQAASQRKAKPSGASLALGIAGAGLAGASSFTELGGDWKKPFAKA